MRYVILRWKDYEDKDKYDLDDSGYSGEKKSVRKKKKKKRKEPSEKAVLVIDQGRITVAGGGGQKQDIKKFIN